jgi:hypothetical protein
MWQDSVWCPAAWVAGMLSDDLMLSVEIKAEGNNWYVVVIAKTWARRLGPFNVRQAQRTANEECRRLGLPPEWAE